MDSDFTNVKMTETDLSLPTTIFWEKYQKGAIFTCLSTSMNFDYIGLGVIGESGEIAENFKKHIRGDYYNNWEHGRDLLIKEIGDVLWYCALAFHLKNMCMPKTPDIRIGVHYKFQLNDARSFVLYMKTVLGFVETSFEEISFHYMMGYLQEICYACGISIKEAALQNNNKLLDRYERNMLMGAGNTR